VAKIIWEEKMSKNIKMFALIVLLVMSTTAFGQVNITSFGSTYTENFNTLATSGTSNAWTNNSTIAGWYSNRTVYIGDVGSSNTGGLHSYGATSDPERALGSLGSNSANPVLHGIRLQNNTGGTIDTLVISYIGEQWRDASSYANTLYFEYQVGATVTDITAGVWTSFSSLDFTNLQNSTAGAIDGNSASNQTAFSNVKLTVSIPAGYEIMLRWRDVDDTGADHGLGIDNFSVTAYGTIGGNIAPFIFNVSRNPLIPLASQAATVTAKIYDDYTSLGNIIDTLFYAINNQSSWLWTLRTGYNPTDSIFSYTIPGQAGGDTVFYKIVAADTNGNSSISSVFQYTVPLEKTIYEIQGQTSSSPYIGRFVHTEGIVTGVFQNRFFIEQRPGGAWNGLYVYRTSGTPSVAIGDSVGVIGTISEYLSLTELDISTNGQVTVRSSGLVLPDTTGLLITAVQEDYEGCLIRIDSLHFKTVGTFAAQTNYYVYNNSESESLVVRIDAGASTVIGQSIPTDTIAIIGNLAQYNADYQLWPRILSDINRYTISNEPPTISNVTRTPTNPSASDVVIVKAKIFDDFCPLANIIDSLHYAINDSSTWTKVYHDSTHSNDSTFYYSIPPTSIGNTVYYYIWAKDDSNASSRSATASYSITGVPTVSILARPRYVEGSATSGTPGTGTPFAIYTGVQSLVASDSFYIKGRIASRGLTWNTNRDRWSTDTDTWAVMPKIITGSASETTKTWVSMKALPAASEDTVLTFRVRRISTSTIYDSPVETIKVLDVSSSGDGGWIYGHIYESNGGPARENVVVLAYQADEIVGSYITENNNINEGYTSDAGYIRMAVKSGTIDSIQVRNRNTNDYMSFYTQSAGPWTVTAGESTCIDLTNYLDVGVFSVDNPSGTIYQGHSYPVKATVKNYGNVPAPSFDVIFNIAEGKVGEYCDTFTVPGLSVGQELQITFGDAYLASDLGLYTTEARTTLFGDANFDNDVNIGSGFEVVVGSAGGWAMMDSIPVSIDAARLAKAIKDGGAMTGVPGEGKEATRLFAFTGTKTPYFLKYTLGTGWTYTPSDTMLFGNKFKYGVGITPDKYNKKYPGKGAALCFDGVNTIYATKGNGTWEFWAYDLTTGVWTAKAFAPSAKALKGGTSLCWYDGKVYMLAGAQKKDELNNFFAYDPLTDAWTTLAGVTVGINTKPWKDGSSINVLGGMIYAVKGGDKTNLFYTYDPIAGTWAEKEEIPVGDSLDHKWKKKLLVKDGAVSVVGDGVIYAMKGGATTALWKYTPGVDSGVWENLDPMPIEKIDKKHRPKTGAAATYVDGAMYLLVGNKQPEFWRYAEPVKSVKPATITSVTTGKTTTIHNFNFSVSTNPFNKTTTINYTVPVNGRVAVKLYNASGRMIEALVNDNLSAGTYSYNLLATKLAKGVYFVKYASETNNSEVKLIVQ